MIQQMMRKRAQNGAQNDPKSDEKSSSNDDASHDTRIVRLASIFGPRGGEKQEKTIGKHMVFEKSCFSLRGASWTKKLPK